MLIPWGLFYPQGFSILYLKFKIIMKFVSKHSNLLIVLTPGLPANALAGVAARPGLNIKFKNGVVEVKDEEIVTKMKSHPGFNVDYIAVDDKIVNDPFEGQRSELEPAHVITEMSHGEIASRKVSKKNKLTPELERMIQSLATEKAKAMLPNLIEEAIDKIAKNYQEKKQEIKENK